MINTLILLLSLSAPRYAPETIIGVLSFDVLYNGLRVGLLSDQPFAKGFIKGGVLGLCQFTAKVIDAKQPNVYLHTPIKTVFNLCNSATDNLQNNIGALDRIYFPFGLGTYVWEKGTLGYVSINPIGVGVLISEVVNGMKFDLKDSILTTTPIFTGLKDQCGAYAAGCYASGVIIIDDHLGVNKSMILHHELNHAFFFDSFKHLDTAFDYYFNRYLFNFKALKYIELHRDVMTAPFVWPAYDYRFPEIEAYTLTEYL